MQLVTIPGTTFQLDAPAAAALERAIHDGAPVEINSAYRTVQDQQQLINLHAINPTKYAYAAPVNQSEHVTGNAIDAGPNLITWLVAHPDYGFTRTALPDEPWHFAYRIALDKHNTILTPLHRKAQTMIIIRRNSDGAAFLLVGTTGVGLTNAQDLASSAGTGIPIWDVSDGTYLNLSSKFLH